MVDKLLISVHRPVADLVWTLGGKLGYDPVDANLQPINNAALISAALADRTKSVITLPAGGIEITEPIVWPARTGIKLIGAARNWDRGDNAFSGSSSGGTCTRIIARFDTTNEPMIRYQGIGGDIRDIAFQGYRMRHGNQWNRISAATNATPIVCTTPVVHDLVDGDQVTIYGALGNTAANGTFYVDSLTSTTFALYSDSGLTSGVAGNGTYTASSANWNPVNRAQIGIHVVPQVTSGIATGKLRVSQCSFHDIPVPMLFGKSMDQAYEELNDGEYDGWDASNADESVIDFCSCHWPYQIAAGEHRTAIYFRTIQAVGFTIDHLMIQGVATEGLYVERGGEIDATVYVNGDCTKAVVRVGKASLVSIIDVWMNIDGSASAGSVGKITSPLSMDRHASGGSISIRGNHKPAWGHNTFPIQLPQFLIRGACKIKIEDFNGLVPDGIQMIGETVGSSPATYRPAMVTLDNSKLYFTNDPADLIVPVGANPDDSVAPLLLRWYDCDAGFMANGADTLDMQPITDGMSNQLGAGVPFGP